jgi:hypothetical protein
LSKTNSDYGIDNLVVFDKSKTCEYNQITRSNAYTLDWEGNGWFAGEITIGADNKRLATVEEVSTIVAAYINEALGGEY